MPVQATGLRHCPFEEVVVGAALLQDHARSSSQGLGDCRGVGEEVGLVQESEEEEELAKSGEEEDRVGLFVGVLVWMMHSQALTRISSGQRPSVVDTTY